MISYPRFLTVSSAGCKMSEWFSSLSGFEFVLYLIAIISTLIFLIKSGLMLFGVGMDVDVDVDVSDSTDMVEADDSGPGLHFFTLHGILAFFCVGSWASIGTYSGSGSIFLALLVGTIAGAIMMVLCAYIVRALMNLEENGIVDLKKAIGVIGDVYLTVPKHDEGEGTVNIPINNKIESYSAICLDDTPIETGTKVRVVDLTDNNVLVVQRESEELV